MFEKVNPSHPDKVADRIAGAIVDLAYAKERDPKIAVEVLIGHGECHIIAETSEHFTSDEIAKIVTRIVEKAIMTTYTEVQQDKHLAENQNNKLRCGDNGIFTGVPTTEEQKKLSAITKIMYGKYPHDGKYILDGERIYACQSHITTEKLKEELSQFPINVGKSKFNPLGDWTGGTEVDTGATNRKLGSDMGDAVTGGGLHGKDLSKADVSVNIYAHLRAQKYGHPVKLKCAIGDEYVDGLPYIAIVETARAYIEWIGGFEKFAEWGLI